MIWISEGWKDMAGEVRCGQVRFWRGTIRSGKSRQARRVMHCGEVRVGMIGFWNGEDRQVRSDLVSGGCGKLRQVRYDRVLLGVMRSALERQARRGPTMVWWVEI